MPHLPAHALSDLRIFAVYAIFFGSYLVFALGKFPGMKIDRPGAAIIGAVLMIAFRVVEPADALAFIDFGTIVLLFSMMPIVAYLHLAGFLDWVAELVVTRLRPHQPLPTVVFTSGILSAFFVNDIICLVMVPFALTATKRMGVRPVPYLLAVATASNIGSVATTIVVAALSNLVSNVPAVMLLKSVVPGFRNPHTGWLVLAMASTLAGNLTITGSVANIIVVERARSEVTIGFRDYLRVGVPVTVATLLLGAFGCGS